MHLLQDWTTIAGSGTTPFVQSVLDWADLARFADVVFWLEVRAVANPGPGSVTLSYETAPAKDDALFRAVASVTLAAASAPVITKVRLADNPTVPLARWLRWKLEGTAAGDWSASFRIFVSGGHATTAFSPANLPLTGWWRASYAGSPWEGNPSAGGSDGRSLAESTNAPTVGSAVNGLTPAAFNGVDTILNSDAYVETLLPATECSGAVLFYANSAAAPAGVAYDDPALLSEQYAFSFTFCSAGLGYAWYDTAWNSPHRVACSTGAWHLGQFRFDGSNFELRVDSGSWSSFAEGTRDVIPSTYSMRVGYAELSSAVYFDGSILEIMTSGVALADDEFDSIKSYVNARYGLSL